MAEGEPKLSPLQRLLYGVLWVLGKLLAVLPDSFARGLCWILGRSMDRFSSRAHAVRGALERCFPEREGAWRERIARLHAERMFEMFLLILAMPHWSEKEVRRRFAVAPSLDEIFQRHGGKRPLLLALPHSTLMEAMTALPLLARHAPPITTLYRELDLPAAERYVRRARERWGVRFVARKEGLLKAKRAMAEGDGGVGLLFDQSAGHRGHLTLFFDRTCTTSNLSGLLAAKTGAVPVFLQVRRTGFWCGVMEGVELPPSDDPLEVVFRLNEELEAQLAGDDDICANWFWAHLRWKGPQRSHLMLAFRQRKSYLDQQLRRAGRAEMPRKTRIAVRLDPRPEHLATGRRVLEIIRSQRPDAVFWLLIPETLAEADLPPADRRFPLASDPATRRAQLEAINALFVDALFSFDDSPSAVRERRIWQVEFAAGIIPPRTRRIYDREYAVDASSYAIDPWSAWRELLPTMGLPAEVLEESK
ncbi:MAG: lysophospholipid acyltransferase family protein [Opitutales bacterium]